MRTKHRIWRWPRMDHRTLVLLAGVWLGLAGGVAGQDNSKPANKDQPAPAENRLAKLWGDLVGSDEGRAARAVLVLAQSPKETLVLLKEKLRPVKDDPPRVARLIADLGDEKFPVREGATQDLEYYGKTIKEHLVSALATKPAPEIERRLKLLLNKLPRPDEKPRVAPPLPAPGQPIRVSSINGRVSINGIPLERYLVPPTPSGGPPVSLHWVRAARAIAVLETIQHPEARQLLENLAQGDADALPTREAREALERMKK